MDNQVVIVTGGGRGIGYGIASCFAEKGASLVLADVNLDTAQKAAMELNAKGAANSIAVACDVTDRDQVVHMADVAVETFGRVPGVAVVGAARVPALAGVVAVDEVEVPALAADVGNGIGQGRVLWG